MKNSLILLSVVALGLAFYADVALGSSVPFSNLRKNHLKNSQNTSTIAGIVETCYYFLDLHLCEGVKWEKPFHFYKPSVDKYSSDQWLWDSGSHMITWSSRNITNSILDLRTMLQFQQPDGRIPEQIYWQERTPAEEKDILMQYSNTQFNDITQMPVLPYSLRSIFNVTKDTALLKEFLYPLVSYFDWWRAVRDTGNDAVFILVHLFLCCSGSFLSHR
jgi:hypothetical protein